MRPSTPPSRPRSNRDDERVLFYLPVTKAWLRQLILALTLICHSSLRGVVELLRDLFDYPLSVGTVHNVLQSAVGQARLCNEQQDLSGIRIGAHDEIFQGGRPVLAGVDTDSTYCYLLSLEDHRDANTWGLRLLERKTKASSPRRPSLTPAKESVPDKPWPCRKCPAAAMSFMPCKPSNRWPRFWRTGRTEPSASRPTSERKKARLEVAGPTHATRCRREARPRHTVKKPERSPWPATWPCCLQWLREDVLSLAGPDHAIRVTSCSASSSPNSSSRQSLCSHRIGPVVRALANQRDDLLAFAAGLDRDLEVLAAEFQVRNVETARDVLNIEAPRTGEARPAGLVRIRVAESTRQSVLFR